MTLFSLPIPNNIQTVVSSGEKVKLGTPLATGRISTKKIKIEAVKILQLSKEDLAKCLIKKAGDEVKAGEILAKKPGKFFKKSISLASPNDGFIEEIDLGEGIISLGLLRYDYELLSPGAGEVIQITPDKIEIDFDGKEICNLESFGTLAFGEAVVLKENEEGVDYNQVDYGLKDKMLIGSHWGKLAVVKACAVGASAAIGQIFDFSLEEENQYLLRPLDPEGNAGFALVRVSLEEDFKEIYKHKGKSIIISSMDGKLCLFTE